MGKKNQDPSLFLEWEKFWVLCTITIRQKEKIVDLKMFQSRPKEAIAFKGG